MDAIDVELLPDISYILWVGLWLTWCLACHVARPQCSSGYLDTNSIPVATTYPCYSWYYHCTSKSHLKSSMANYHWQLGLSKRFQSYFNMVYVCISWANPKQLLRNTGKLQCMILLETTDVPISPVFMLGHIIIICIIAVLVLIFLKYQFWGSYTILYSDIHMIAHMSVSNIRRKHVHEHLQGEWETGSITAKDWKR